ncbi:hypothetical protein TWF106_000373 [Orbilia oligospora]|uniref:F-box domain-containing protein n=1 Tax=Orbilia oligospora TaxID=2813651 RepID=A0A6G1MI47_ORBOL|nr:hypothetical protein TWF679_002590 [Orbilia oligospora]KAF3207394.1 hypothetical protein TWF106_000373 [Orbilia oligospora]KAF3231606.1 hypothetical protein TWF191_005672 [Orbilia oligospora]KAF3257761.1 hypothetical protein TWF192_001048 [Orbilia oligospora]
MSHNPPSHSTFLSLPREIRDEIFSYLLICGSPPRLNNYPNPIRSFDHLPSKLPISYIMRCRHLSLFRVSKQIHREAAEVFYKRNVWPIRMVIARESAESPDCRFRLHVTYETPWEEVAYGVGDDEGTGKFYDLERFYNRYGSGELEDKEAILCRKPDLYPSSRYRSFLRKVRVEVIDFRFHESVGEPAIKIPHEDFILSPFVGKLRALLEPAGENVVMNIKFMRDWRSGLRSTGEPNGGIDGGGVISLDTVRPLTKGAWKCYIHADINQYGDGRVFRCRAAGNRDENNMVEGGSETAESEEVSVVGDCYYAIVDGKVKLVRNGMRYTCCYGCERRDLERRRLELLKNEPKRIRFG